MPTIETIQSKILHLAGRPPVMTAPDLAAFYETTSKRVHEAARRNPERFPADFAFRLTPQEAKTQNAALGTSQTGGKLPLVFTEAGALALSGVLKTARAAEVSVLVHRAFVALARLARLGPAPSAPPAPGPLVLGMVTVPAEEYIGLLKARIGALEAARLVQRRRAGVLPLTGAEVEAIRQLRREGLSYSAIARQVGRAASTVSMIAREVNHG